MAEDIVIYGAGGLGREIKYLINRFLNKQFNPVAFVVDNDYGDINSSIDGIPVCHPEYIINNKDRRFGVVIAIADVSSRERIYNELKNVKNIFFPSIIMPNCIIAPDAIIGDGVIITMKCTVSINVKIGKFVLMNGCDNLGHDTTVEDFVTIMPSCDISGHVSIGRGCLIGAKSFILQGKSVGENSTVAAGGIVFKNVPSDVTVMGNPATIISKHKGKRL